MTSTFTLTLIDAVHRGVILGKCKIISIGALKDHADIEKIPMQEIERAYERMLKSDVRYRFVIDMASLKRSA